MRFWGLVFLLALPVFAQAAQSDIANRNLGVNQRQVDRVKQAEAVRKGEVREPVAKAKPVEAPQSASDIRFDRLEVYGSAIEELSGPQKTPLQQFSDRMDADRKLTPAQMTQMVLSFFLGGPMPEKEPGIEERTRARVATGGTMLARPPGTLQ